MSKYQDIYDKETIPLYKDLVSSLKEMCCFNYRQLLETDESKSKSLWESLKHMFVGDKREDKLKKLECDHDCYSF